MITSKAPVLDDVHVLCDWFELSVLSSKYGTFPFATVQREWDVHRNQEDTDPEGGDSQEEAFIELVKSEILARQELLGNVYPFALSATGESLDHVPDITFGNASYLICLLLSHPKAGAVFNGKYLPPIDNKVRDYFQAIATLAAADEVKGHSYSFGFPRPDHTGFLKKLTDIYALFGEGTVVTASIPAGASKSPKDEQIDVIAWQPKADGAAGKSYLLAQVASGANWIAKTILGGPINSFHQLWFPRAPASQHVAAIFVPICLGNLVDGSSADKINADTYEFGHIFYRFRIPVQAANGLELAQQRPDLAIERTADEEHIKTWVLEQIKELKLRSSYASPA